MRSHMVGGGSHKGRADLMQLELSEEREAHAKTKERVRFLESKLRLVLERIDVIDEGLKKMRSSANEIEKIKKTAEG